MMGLQGRKIDDRVRKYELIWADIRHEQKYRQWDPAPLPKRRKRSLSGGNLTLQINSSFFQRLPLEVREMIYEHVFVNATRHRHIVEIEACNAEECGPKVRGKRVKNQIWGVRCASLADCMYTADVL